MPNQTQRRRLNWTRSRWRRVWNWRTGWVSLVFLLLGWLLITLITLRTAAAAPVDTFLVLGGSIRREIYVAELVKQQPNAAVLISHGSPDPCIWLIFQRAQAPVDRVWLEKCADSTFDNFYYSLPILRQWGARKVKLITSETHLPRAKWLAQILLGAHGIWVEVEVAPEVGVPANQETWLKTSLDISRSLPWAVLSQVYFPRCSQVIPLSTVDLATWEQRGFQCERQGQLQ